MNKLGLTPFIIAVPFMLFAIFTVDEIYDCDSLTGENWKNICEERQFIILMIITPAFLIVASITSILISNNQEIYSSEKTKENKN